MQEPTKMYLPTEWLCVADAVDAYESDAETGFPSLQPYVQRVDPTYQLAALTELVKVDLERRWLAGKPRRVELYLEEHPDLNNSSVSIVELLEQECRVRRRCADRPSLKELNSRFPAMDEDTRRRIEACLSDHQVGADDADSAAPEVSLPDAEILQRDSRRETDLSAEVSADPWGTIRTSVEPHSPAVVRDTKRGGGSATDVPVKAPGAESAHQGPEKPGPTAIGRYLIGKRLGSGGFGVVYRCYDKGLKRHVAVKVPHEKSWEHRLEGFLHEAQSAARLKHPGIVTVLESNQTEDGRPFIVYEFIDGMTLRERIKQGNYGHEQAANWVAQTGLALHHAHTHGIVHRDVKPTNILLDKDGRPHVADFGLAKMDDHYFRDDVGAVVGSLAYMSPEQAAGKSQWSTPQSDIYSLGVVLYELLCRQRPFKASDQSEAIAEIRGRIPPPPRTIDDKIPKPLEDVCLKAISKDPANRYTTAADMAAELQAAVAGRPTARMDRRYVIGAAAAALVALAILPYLPGRPAPPDPPRAPFPIPGDELRFDVHYQGAAETHRWHSASREGITLRDDDKVQFRVELLGPPRYFYLYWYDPIGQPTRLWPFSDADLDQQKKVNRIILPTEHNENLWFPISPDRGAEFALVAFRDQPLDAAALQRFERHVPFPKGAVVKLDEVIRITPKEVEAVLRERGIDVTPTESPKNPVTEQFRDVLLETFEQGFYGLVIPHK